MDVWEVPRSSRSGLDRGFLMDVGPTRARGEVGGLAEGQNSMGKPSEGADAQAGGMPGRSSREGFGRRSRLLQEDRCERPRPCETGPAVRLTVFLRSIAGLAIGSGRPGGEVPYGR